ncbi:MAG: hypothetical protein K9N35_06485 [Candidatus Marinimicrobia bacterium]|nr:hypothetical protein [Candidatus Neomarinimicrobiota bacterium]
MRNSMKTLALILILGISIQAQSRGKGMHPHNMDAIRIWRLVEVLELTEDQTLTFLPMIQIHERKLKEAQKEFEALDHEGEALLKKGSVSQEEVNKLILKYNDSQKKMHDIKHEFIKSLPDYLTPQQQLLYLSFESRFRSDLKQYMKDRRFGPEEQGSGNP